MRVEPNSIPRMAPPDRISSAASSLLLVHSTLLLPSGLLLSSGSRPELPALRAPRHPSAAISHPCSARHGTEVAGDAERRSCCGLPDPGSLPPRASSSGPFDLEPTGATDRLLSRTMSSGSSRTACAGGVSTGRRDPGAAAIDRSISRTASAPASRKRLVDRRQRRPEVRRLGDVVHADDRRGPRGRAGRADGRHGGRRGPSGRCWRRPRRCPGCGRGARRGPPRRCSAVQSPWPPAASSEALDRAPRASRASPSSRCCASHQVSGPVMMPTRRAPPARRCSVARRPMAALSMPIDGSDVWPPMPPTSTTGTGSSGPCRATRPVVAHLRDGPDDAVHLARDQRLFSSRLDVLRLRLVDEVERDRVAHLGGLLLDARQDAGRPEVVEAVGDDAEDVAPALGQAAGKHVRRVAGLGDDLLDPLAASRARRRGGC